MAEQTFRLEVVTPVAVVFDGQVTAAQLPAADGLMGVLPNHAPLVCALDLGPVTITDDSGAIHQLLITDGFFQVADNHARILADAGESAEDIDVTRAEAAEKRARERLALRAQKDTTQRDLDFRRAERALQRALWRRKLGRRG